MKLIAWLLAKPTRDDYEYPGHYDPAAYVHALAVAMRPIEWRWPVAQCIRAWKAVSR